jgi:hypothetical protein
MKIFYTFSFGDTKDRIVKEVKLPTPEFKTESLTNDEIEQLSKTCFLVFQGINKVDIEKGQEPNTFKKLFEYVLSTDNKVKELEIRLLENYFTNFYEIKDVMTKETCEDYFKGATFNVITPELVDFFMPISKFELSVFSEVAKKCKFFEIENFLLSYQMQFVNNCIV